MKIRSHHFWFIAITLLFIVTRLLGLKSAGSFWFDEAFSVHFSQKSISELWQFLQFEHNPLVHFLSLHYWMMVFGISEFSARALSFFAGLGSLFGVYYLGKILFSKEVGLWSMFLMTISVFFLYHQTEARMYSLLTLFAIWSLIGFWNYFCHRTGSREQGSWEKRFWLGVYGLSTVLLVHTHITAWVLPIAIWLYWLVETKPQFSEWKSWFVVNGLVIASFLFWFFPVMKNKLLAGHISQGWFFFQQDGGFTLSHMTNYFISGETSIILRTLSAGILVYLVLASCSHLEKPSWFGKVKNFFDKTQWQFSLTLEWTKELRLILAIILVGFVLGFAFQVTVTKYLLAPGIAFMLLIGKGLSKQIKSFKMGLATFLVITVLPMQGTLLFTQRHHWNIVASEIKEIANSYPEALLLSHSFVWSLPLEFHDYGPKEITPFYPLPDQLSFEERVVRYNWQAIVNSDNVELLEEIVGTHNEVLLISSTQNEDERDPVKRWFYQRGWRLEKTRNWNGYGDPELVLFRKNEKID